MVPTGQLDLESILNVQQAIIHRPDLGNRLPGITIPSLVLVGDEDVALPPARSRRMAAALPDARYREVAGAGHLAAVEQPEAVTRQLLDFLGAAYA